MVRQQQAFQMDQECSLHILRPYLQWTFVIWIPGPLGSFRRTEGSSAFITTTKEAVKYYLPDGPIESPIIAESSATRLWKPQISHSLLSL
jgi:hypothetical protein